MLRSHQRPALVDHNTVSAAHTGWMMTSTALVLLMTLPGSLFICRMVRRKNVTPWPAYAIAALVTAAVCGGVSLAFTPGSAELGGLTAWDSRDSISSWHKDGWL